MYSGFAVNLPVNYNWLQKLTICTSSDVVNAVAASDCKGWKVRPLPASFLSSAGVSIVDVYFVYQLQCIWSCLEFAIDCGRKETGEKLDFWCLYKRTSC